RLLAALPSDSPNGRDQDRYLMMPLVPSPPANAAHTPRRFSSRTDGALHNIEVDDQSQARSPSLNAASTHQDRPIMPPNLRHRLCRSPCHRFDMQPAASKSP